jgi:hypothetical protein
LREIKASFGGFLENFGVGKIAMEAAMHSKNGACENGRDLVAALGGRHALGIGGIRAQ